MLFVSSHQFPFYPGTGATSEIGRGAGAGFTLNIPLEAGTKDDEIERLYARSRSKVRASTDFCDFCRIRRARA